MSKNVMSFQKCLQDATVFEKKDPANKSPALVEYWIDECYKCYCNAALAATDKHQKQKALALIWKNLEHKFQFVIDNPRRYCDDVSISALETISKYFHWVTYLKLLTEDSNDFDELEERIDTMVADFEMSFENLSKDSILNAMAVGVHNNTWEAKAALYYKIGRYFFSNGVVYLEKNEDRAAKYSFEEIRRPIESFRKIFRESKSMNSLSESVKEYLEDLDDEIEILEEETLIEMTQTVGRMALKIADEEHRKVMLETEELDFDKVYDVYDLYHFAWTQVREKDIELEALLMSRMGTYQYKVLKLQNSKFKAREYLKKSIELGLSLSPRNVTFHDWYKDAENYLRELQKDTLQSEYEKIEAEKKKFEKELKEVKAFLDSCRGNVALQLKTEVLKIVDKYPPKVPAFKLENLMNADGDAKKKVK